jgi:hypothetical protein
MFEARLDSSEYFFFASLIYIFQPVITFDTECSSQSDCCFALCVAGPGFKCFVLRRVTIRGYVVFLSFQTFRSLKLDQERFSSTFVTILIDGRWVAESDVKYSLIFRGFYGDGRLWPSVVLLHRLGSGTSHVTSAVMNEAVYFCETSVPVWKVARCHSPVG